MSSLDPIQLYSSKTFVYELSEQQFNQPVYVQGKIEPVTFELVVAYIQGMMQELEPHIQLYPEDIAYVLRESFGFFILVEPDASAISIDTRLAHQHCELPMEELLSMPFYQIGLIQRLRKIVKDILIKFNGETVSKN